MWRLFGELLFYKTIPRIIANIGNSLNKHGGCRSMGGKGGTAKKLEEFFSP
jgi:hypothetical protein